MQIFRMRGMWGVRANRDGGAEMTDMTLSDGPSKAAAEKRRDKTS